MNQVALIGRIVREVELKQVGDNRTVLNNTLAVARIYKKENSQDTDFIPFTVWGKAAELIHAYCKKGDQIGLTGRVQSRSYVKANQEQVFVVELVGEEVQFLQSKREDDSFVTR